jgi:hypothetical protein
VLDRVSFFRAGHTRIPPVVTGGDAGAKTT